MVCRRPEQPPVQCTFAVHTHDDDFNLLLFGDLENDAIRLPRQHTFLRRAPDARFLGYGRSETCASIVFEVTPVLRHTEVSGSAESRYIGQLLDDVGRRTRMSQRGRALVDGLGATRTAEMIDRRHRARAGAGEKTTK